MYHTLAPWLHRGHVQEGTNATVLVPDVQHSAIVKAGALMGGNWANFTSDHINNICIGFPDPYIPIN